MRGKPSLTDTPSGDSACTIMVVFDASRNAQEGDVDVRESPKESEKESERGLHWLVLCPSLPIVGYLNFVVVNGGTNSLEFSLHSTGV